MDLCELLRCRCCKKSQEFVRICTSYLPHILQFLLPAFSQSAYNPLTIILNPLTIHLQSSYILLQSAYNPLTILLQSSQNPFTSTSSTILLKSSYNPLTILLQSTSVIFASYIVCWGSWNVRICKNLCRFVMVVPGPMGRGLGSSARASYNSRVAEPYKTSFPME